MSQVAVITGGTAGLGRAIARVFAQNGYKVGVMARGESRLTETEKELRGIAPDALAVKADVADFDQIEKAADKIEKQLGEIDVWVNNAMTSVFAPFANIEPEEYQRVTEVTYLGQVWGAKVALSKMMPRDKGKIIFVGSALAYRGIPLQSAYCGSKHATQGFFDSLRAELIHRDSGIKLSMAQLPAMNTPQFEWVLSKLPKKPQPVPPIYQPEVAANAIYWLSNNDRREILVGFSTAKAVYGNKIAPGFLDEYLAETGYKSQMTKKEEDKDRPSNLWEPVEGDWEAHGRFTKKARDSSWYTWLAINKTKALTIFAMVLFFLAGFLVLLI